MNTYFQDIKDGVRSTLKGLQLTFRHFRHATERRKPLGISSDNYFEQVNGLVTVQYPHEKLPIPDNGRYRLDNEIDDCIVCDKCAKVCPVDCITIEAIKATEEIGRASDGSPIRLYAGKFDIDMAKCCYCGLCTVVCPTECLTMEKTFDYSEYELGKLTYGFSNLTADEADEKRKLYEQFVAEKEAIKAQQAAAKAAIKPLPVAPETSAESTEAKPAPKRPLFKPSQKPAPAKVTGLPATGLPATGLPATETTIDAGEIQVEGIPSPESPALLTTDKGVSTSGEAHPKADEDNTVQPTETPAPKPARPAFRPSMKPTAAKPETALEAVLPVQTELAGDVIKAKPAFRPTMKPAAVKTETAVELAGKTLPTADETTVPALPVEEAPKPKPAFRPTMKPKATPPTELTPLVENKAEPPLSSAESATVAEEAPKPKPAFRPTMKPKPPTEE